MSLLDGNVRLSRLYQIAQANSTDEHESQSFWNYYLSKVIFTEDAFYVDPGKPASAKDPLRRVDLVVKYFEAETYIPRVLVFYEAKKHSSSKTQMRDVEGQAHEACATYCGNTGFTHVYAMTTLGTTARLWKFVAKSTLTPLFGSSKDIDRESYIDAASSQAYLIKDNLIRMKSFPPSQYEGQAYSQVGISHTASATLVKTPLNRNFSN